MSLDLFRLLLGPGFRPRRVLLPHAPVGPPSYYRSFFSTPVTFEAEVCGFDVDAAELDRPRPGDDPVVREVVEGYLATAVASGAGGDLPGRVRPLVRRTLSTGHTSIGVVATHLGVHPRALQRGLRRAGTTFELLVDDVRRERAEHYLRHSERSLGQIATLLGNRAELSEPLGAPLVRDHGAERARGGPPRLSDLRAPVPAAAAARRRG